MKFVISLCLLAAPIAAIPVHAQHGFADADSKNDASLRFMGRMAAQRHEHSHEAVQDRICSELGYKAAERVGCVDFMRQACSNTISVSMSTARCQKFFQEKPDHPLGVIDQAAKDTGRALQEAGLGPRKPPGLKKPKKEEKDEPEEKEVPSEPGCKNFPKGWESKRGSDCEDYAEGQWCTRHGGYGDAWMEEWGKFEDDAKDGKSALDVCCVCGGGWKKGEPMPVFPGSSGPTPSAAMAPSPAGPQGPILGTKDGRPLQEQGYTGDLVEHVDEKTMTEDWGREFGPGAGHRGPKTICEEWKKRKGFENEWCLMHGYYDDGKKSSAPRSLAPLSGLVFLLLAMQAR